MVQVLDLKTGIDFGATGNLKDYDPTGFSAIPDSVTTWSEAAVAELTFRLPPPRHDVRFVIAVVPYLGDGRIPQQSCWVFFNGLFVHYQTIKAPVEMTFTVSRDLFSPRANRLSFALPNAIAPKEVGLGDDLRLLGLSFVKLRAGDPNAVADRGAPAAAAPEKPPARVPARPAAPRSRR
ncbi:MAG TPA: hypothetical protein VND95_17450 [Stellaceae bacterium]|nr:hypothetical protein [Stellaceae bacterium]